jgi:hypothetical protein
MGQPDGAAQTNLKGISTKEYGMSKWIKVSVLGLLLLGALALAVTGIAYAQDDGNDEIVKLYGFPGHGKGGRGLGSEVALQAAADALGMTTDELSTQLWGGKTLADLAEEKGVALEDVQAAVEAAQTQAYRDSLSEAVTNGTITQENADWLLEGLDKGFIHPFGGGFGFHGRGFGGPDFPLPAAPEASTGDS